MDNINKYIIYFILLISVLLNLYLLHNKKTIVVYDYEETKRLHELYRQQQDSIILEHKKEVRRLNADILGLEKRVKIIKENKIKNEKIIDNANLRQLDSLWRSAGY